MSHPRKLKEHLILWKYFEPILNTKTTYHHFPALFTIAVVQVPWLPNVTDMSPIDNEIHPVLVTCYNILNGTASKIDAEMHALSWCIKSPMTRWQSGKSDRLSPPLKHSRNMHSQSYQVPQCRTQQKKASLVPSHHCRLEPPISDSSAEWISRVLQGYHYLILSLNLSLFSYCYFFSFLQRNSLYIIFKLFSNCTVLYILVSIQCTH